MEFLVIWRHTSITTNLLTPFMLSSIANIFYATPATPPETHQTVNKLEKMAVQKCYYCFKPIPWCNETATKQK